MRDSTKPTTQSLSVSSAMVDVLKYAMCLRRMPVFRPEGRPETIHENHGITPGTGPVHVPVPVPVEVGQHQVVAAERAIRLLEAQGLAADIDGLFLALHPYPARILHQSPLAVGLRPDRQRLPPETCRPRAVP